MDLACSGFRFCLYHYTFFNRRPAFDILVRQEREIQAFARLHPPPPVPSPLSSDAHSPARSPPCYPAAASSPPQPAHILGWKVLARNRGDSEGSQPLRLLSRPLSPMQSRPLHHLCHDVAPTAFWHFVVGDKCIAPRALSSHKANHPRSLGGGG